MLSASVFRHKILRLLIFLWKVEFQWMVKRTLEWSVHLLYSVTCLQRTGKNKETGVNRTNGCQEKCFSKPWKDKEVWSEKCKQQHRDFPMFCLHFEFFFTRTNWHNMWAFRAVSFVFLSLTKAKTLGPSLGFFSILFLSLPHIFRSLSVLFNYPLIFFVSPLQTYVAKRGPGS